MLKLFYHKRMHLLLALMLIFIMPFQAYASWETIDIKNEEQISSSVYDGASLLSEDEASQLRNRLTELSSKYECDFSVITLESTYGSSLKEYGKAIYKRCGYGYGPDEDGVMFLISMDNREWRLLTYGYGLTAITDYGVDYFSEHIVPYLSDGDYSGAFNKYADLLDAFFKEAEDGMPYDGDNPAKLSASEKAMGFLLAYGIAFIIALIICLIIVFKMRHVSESTEARNYIKNGSFQLTGRRDYYLYTTTIRTKHESEKSSSHGSSHDSDGFGGGGGHF